MNFLDRFQETKFTGNKSLWTDFKFEIEQALSLNSDTIDHGREYLFENFPEDVDGNREIPERWRPIPMLESLTGVAGVPEARQKQRSSRIKEIRDANAERSKLVAACMTIMVSRVSDAIRRDLQAVAGSDANLAWHRLEELYGPVSSGPNDFSTAFQRVIGSRMDPQARFDAFMTQFEIDATYCQLSNSVKRSILLSDRSNPLKM